MDDGFSLNFIPPPASIAAYVEYIGMFQNDGHETKEVVVLPDGRIDLFFWQNGNEPFQVMLKGLETTPEQRFILPQTKAFVISFKPLAVEYILQTSIADFLNTATMLPDDFWAFSTDILNDFDVFYQRTAAKINSLLPVQTDSRKLKLFDLIYESNGQQTVAQLSEQVGWSSRQINRYFNQYLGLSLKAYCDILRFRASLQHIAHGKLFPELKFTDQAYFIKAIKKFSGVIPKELSRNKNDRFLLLSLMKLG